MSEIEAKRSVFRAWLLPELGTKRIDAIGVRDIEALKAKMLKKGRSAKRVNNTLTTVLNRMLKYAVEIEIIEAAPTVRFVKMPPQEFDFLDFAEYERLVEAAKEEPPLYGAVLAAASGCWSSRRGRARRRRRSWSSPGTRAWGSRSAICT